MNYQIVMPLFSLLLVIPSTAVVLVPVCCPGPQAWQRINALPNTYPGTRWACLIVPLCRLSLLLVLLYTVWQKSDVVRSFRGVVVQGQYRQCLMLVAESLYTRQLHERAISLQAVQTALTNQQTALTL